MITSFTSVLGAITASEIEGAIKVVIFAILLFALSISTYKKTGIKKMMYAAAFSLFAIQLLFEYLQETVLRFDTPYADTILASITLGILFSFLIFIIKKEKPKLIDQF
jgi:prolipoprotein diacylglyceryltransferase